MSGKKIGIDIGATKTRIGVVAHSQVIKELVIPTSAGAPKEQIIQEIISGVEKLKENEFEGIGIGVPGLVDEEEGIIYDLWNIPSWKEVHLKRRLENHFGKPVSITNDANTFVLGEKAFGKGQEFRNFVGITLGTGFGTGIIIDHKLYSGTLSSAGELADISYLEGTIEDYCSGKFFQNKCNLPGSKIFELAGQGDQKAIQCFNEYGEHLGNAINLIVKILSPQAVFLGGSVSKSFSFFRNSLEQKTGTFPFKKVMDQLVIAPSEMENISILGAAALVGSREPNSKKKILTEQSRIQNKNQS